MLDKLHFSRPIVLSIIVFFFLFLLGGYGLYFNAKSQNVKQDREYAILKEKAMHAQENYDELKNKFENSSTELSLLRKDYQALLQYQQECKEKQEELQTKYDALIINHDKTKSLLRETQIKLGITPEESTSNEHPVKLLNQENADKQGKESDKTAIDINAYRCPNETDLSMNVANGSWKDSHNLNWYVDFTSRPLNDKEAVQALFKILYDGDAIACYYALSADQHTWIVIKSQQPKGKPFKFSEKGWKPCAKDECKFQCDKENLKECTFLLK